MNMIDKAGGTYEKEVRRHLKASKRLGKLKEEVDTFEKPKKSAPGRHESVCGDSNKPGAG